MSSLLLLNGSPRGPRSNSMRMMTPVAAGWRAAGGDEPTVLHLARSADFERAVAEFPEAGDGPSRHAALHRLDARSRRRDSSRRSSRWLAEKATRGSAFLVQSGFSEALHSRGLERYLAKLARRLGSPYAGTIVRGGR